MSKRSIIEINRAKCNGCGLCTKACAEGALALDAENKAYLVREIFCDGLGACLDVCPTGALKVVQKDSEEYNPKETFMHVKKTLGVAAAQKVHGAEEITKPDLPCGCPGTMAKEITRKPQVTLSQNQISSASELTQWPIQLKLVSPFAPYFKECDLLIAADCTAFSFGAFHQDFLKDKKLVIACPKLDDTKDYIDKIAEIIKQNTIYSLTVAIMVVPCCSGLFQIVQAAVQKSGKNIAIKKVVIDLEGNLMN